MQRESQEKERKERGKKKNTQNPTNTWDPKGIVSVVIFNNPTPGYLKAFVTKLMSD